MRVLLDENLPHKLRLALKVHDIFTVSYLGWSGLANGVLLAKAEENGIEVLVTGDTSLHKEQNLTNKRIAVARLTAIKWPIIRGHLDSIQSAIYNAFPGSFQTVHCVGSRRGK